MISVPQLFIVVLTVVMALLVVVWPYWRIFGKAGFSPGLSLLMVVPVANVIMLFFLAFARWPALDKAPDK